MNVKIQPYIIKSPTYITSELLKDILIILKYFLSPQNQIKQTKKQRPITHTRELGERDFIIMLYRTMMVIV